MTAATAKMRPSIKSLPRATNAGSMASKDGESLTQSQDIPIGFCQCGCGQKTTIPVRDYPDKKWVMGVPRRWCHGHNNRRTDAEYVEEDRGHSTACWIWQLAIDPYGYGKRKVNGRVQKAHQLVFEQHRGRIPDGLVLDHLCSVRSCVNPDHLEPVTNLVNIQRAAEKRREIATNPNSERDES